MSSVLEARVESLQARTRDRERAALLSSLDDRKGGGQQSRCLEAHGGDEGSNEPSDPHGMAGDDSACAYPVWRGCLR